MTGNLGREEVGLVGLGGGNLAGTGGPEVMGGGRIRRREVGGPPNSILTMLIPGTKLAPKKFWGDFHKVQEFLQHFERLCLQHNIMEPQEICEAIFWYCSRREQQMIQVLAPFQTNKWPKLRSAIMQLYDADLDTRRFWIQDLKALMKKQKEKRIWNGRSTVEPFFG